MKEVCRIEIVVGADYSADAIRLLSKLGLESYSLIRAVQGAGERGQQWGDDITGVNNNHYILTTCPPELLDRVNEALRPLLRRVGGLCLVSDARWLMH